MPVLNIYMNCIKLH